jgi:phosphate/phosphite/phosphonate ABC transporter binding protein
MKRKTAFASMIRRGAAYCLCLCFLWAPGSAPAETQPSLPSRHSITVAIIPFYSPEKIWLLYSPFIEYLKTATDLSWELKLYPDHNSLIEDLCSDKIDIALLGPVPMGRVNQRCGVNPFLAALSKDGKPSYHSVLVTGDLMVTALRNVRGKKIGFFKGSTAAHIMPMKMLKDAGLGMEAFHPVFFESQDRIMTALLTREISAAGVKEALYRRFKDEPLRVLKTSDDLPNFAFCASPALPPEVRERFIAVLTKLKPLSNGKDAATTRIWDDEVKNGFMLPTKAYLESVLKLNSVYQEIMHEAR